MQHANVPELVSYLLGQHDYYKIAKINGDVEIQSFNLYGTLGWGTRVKMPTEIAQIEIKKPNTTLVTFNEEWSISFRIHSASTKVAPSLKFDVQLASAPSNTIESKTIQYFRISE